MPRPQKQTVDYFPHMTVHGKTIMILMNEYGNDGYAFWFQLLELLCVSEGQSYSFETPAAWKLMLAKTHSTDINAKGILELLSQIGAIDLDLYEHHVIWVQNLVDNLDPMYSRRDSGKPSKPSYNGQKPDLSGVSDDINEVPVDSNPLTIVEETIPEETISIYTLWNDQKIITHKKITGSISTAIKTSLKDYSKEDIEQAIKNYALIVHGDEYYFSHSWTLKDFLKRGLDKFLDLEVAKTNYRSDKNGTNRRNSSTKLPDRETGYTPAPYDPQLEADSEAAV